MYSIMEVAQQIGRKWIEYTKNTQGNFLRYIDGNMNNDDADNLQAVSPHDALENIKDWKTDWFLPLSKEEANFVFNNADNFKTLFLASKQAK